MKLKSYLVLILIFLSFKVNAGPDALGMSLQKLGIMANINKPGVMNDQLGGFVTGGSLHTRGQVTDTNLFSIQPPSLNMGCGSKIDGYLGGFGYINSANLQALVKNIGSSALSYGTMLTIKTISPMVGDILSQLESMARFINSQNINSCQLGGSIAAGIWPKTAASQELACQMRKMDSGVGNYFTARYDCGKDDKSQSNKNEYKGILGTEFNLVWHALKKQNPVMEKGKIELLMSISGTLISAPNGGGSVKFSHRHSLIKNSKLLEVLIYGGEKLKLYKCNDSEKCLDVTFREEEVSNQDAYISKIKTLVSNISDKFIQEGKNIEVKFNDEEKHLVETSTVPIIKIISLESALKGHSVGLSIEEYAELIAFDYLISYLDKMIDEVYSALSVLEYSQLEGENIKNFKEEIRYIKTYLFSERQGAFERMNTLLSVKQRVIQLDNMVKATFAEFREVN